MVNNLKHSGAVVSIRIANDFMERFTNLPTTKQSRLNQQNHFFSLLRGAYARDYRQPDRMDIANGKVEWYARLNFTDS